MWIIVESKVDETRAFVAWQRKDGGIHIHVDMLLAELLVEALHGSIGRVVVFAQVAQHDVLDTWMIHLGQKARRLDVAQMAKRARNPLL